MGSKIIMGLVEKERKQAMLLQDPGAQLHFPLFCHRPKKLFRSLLIVIPAIPVFKAVHAVSLKTFVKAWVFWNSMVQSLPLAGVSQ